MSRRRIAGTGALRITEIVPAYDEDPPSCAVSLMEFLDGKAVHETRYFGEPFERGTPRRCSPGP
ncbi:MAG TPA: hypothetical protein VG848_01145 [Acetobacteraceae bacterium]|nr:hypothetical protein [Acetobacteraceae bacterium]